MWNDNDIIPNIFLTIEDGKTEYPCDCPVCNNRDAHIYIHKHNERHCGIWTWCSSCGAFSHMSGNAPKWWKNPDFVDSKQLCGDPEYLDQMKERIDDWINSILTKRVPKNSKPFVIENRFDVILKESLQGIPAGTTGTIVIKDDFKTMTIDFIGTDGKTVSIHELPERILQMVEVVNPTANISNPKC